MSTPNMIPKYSLYSSVYGCIIMQTWRVKAIIEWTVALERKGILTYWNTELEAW